MRILCLPCRRREKEQGIDLHVRTTCTTQGLFCGRHSERGLCKLLGGQGRRGGRGEGARLIRYSEES